MNKGFALSLIAGLVLMGPAFARATDDDDKGDPVPSNVVGVYQIVSGMDKGQPVDASDLEGIRVRITPDIMATADKDGKELYVVKYRLNTDAKPWKIAMTMSGGPRGERGTTAAGIMKVDQDGTLRLAYAEEGGPAPESFDVKAGSKQNLFVLKKIAGEKDQ